MTEATKPLSRLRGVSNDDRVVAQIPRDFRNQLKEESLRRGVSMRKLLALYGDRMIAAIRD